MRFTIQIAGRAVQVSSVRPHIKAFLQEYLCDLPPEIDVGITLDDIERERKVEERAGLSPRPSPQRFVLLRKLSEQLLDYGTLLVHGSCVAVDGEGYLFTAPSGMGKSTHTRLWREMFGSRATMVNDDKPFVRITEDGVTAYGSPWQGSHRLGANIAVPLKAICLLGRSATNHIRPISAEEAFPMLYGQVHRSDTEEASAKVVSLLKLLCGHVKLYALHCNMTTEAARIAYEGMNKE